MQLLYSILLTFFGVLAISATKIYHCTEPNTIALTFDDGPYEYTMDLLDQLQAYDIHVTFFINGYNMWHDLETDPKKQAVLKRAAADGHQIASHTWRHEIPKNKDEIKPMMKRLDDVIEKSVGYRPKYFRPPYGDCDSECVIFFEDLGYHVIQWDTDTNDWNLKMGVDERVAEVKKFLSEQWAQKKKNYLILMHDIHKSTVQSIIPWVLKHAPLDEYKFVTVAECLGNKKEGSSKSKSDSESSVRTSKIEDDDRSLPETDLVAGNNTIIDTTEGDVQNLDIDSSDAQKITYHFTFSIIFLAYILLMHL